MFEKCFTIIGVVIAIVGLFFTGYQIRETNRTLVFTTEQNLYKESREILKSIGENPGMMQLAQLDDVSKVDAKERIKLDAQIGILLNFYNSILLEQNERYISPEFRRSLISDFCAISTLPQISKRLPDKPGRPFETLANIKRSRCNA